MKTKYFLLLIFFTFCLLPSTHHWCVLQAQTELSVQVIDASGNPVTGLTDANIKFRISPYSTGDVIAGITVTEYGTQGQYLCKTFSTFQNVKMFIDGIEQEVFGQQLSGDPGSTFVDQTSTESIGGAKTFTGTVVLSGAGTIISYPAISPTSTWYISGIPGADQSIVWKKYVIDNFMPITGITILDSSFIIRANRIIVDDRLAADIPGLQYNDIKSAMDWIYSNGAPGANTRWTVLIMPSHITSAGYTTDFTWYDYIDLVGLGQVLITNTSHIPPYSIFTRSGSTFVKAENINFYSYDANLSATLMIAINCNFRVELDNYSPNLLLQNSQFQSCGFYMVGGATNSLVGANKIINCYGNTNINWSSSDKVYEYNYITGDDINF